MTCRNGHPKTGTGECRECLAARKSRYAKSDRGKAANRRYRQTLKGKEQHRRSQAKYEAESMTGIQYNLKLLKNRRRAALQAREQRRLRGQVQEQGRD